MANKQFLNIINIKNKITLIFEGINQIPSKYRIIYIITFWIILIALDCITTNRLMNFVIILVLISCYKISHEYVFQIYSYLMNKTDLTDQDITTLLKIYKYKNPVICTIIWIEEKLFNCMYGLTNKNIKHINLIYNLLYNLTGYSGIKIVLYKFYKILIDWKTYTIYDIIFKRIYGMILSVLIFTNIIQIIFWILNAITSNYVLWIYMFLIVLGSISNYMGFREYKNLINIEYSRMESNLIGTILKQRDELLFLKINQIELNKDVKMYLWYLNFSNKELLNYKNFLLYRVFNMLSVSENKEWTEYANKPSLFYLNETLNKFNLIEDSVITKQHKLQKAETLTNEEKQALMYCEYEILIYKLILFYIWDIEKACNIINTYLKIEKKEIDRTFYLYEYDKVYIKNYLNNVETDKFWDLQGNYIFYEKMYNYLNDKDFTRSTKYKKIQNIYFEEESQETWLSGTDEYRGIDLKRQEEYLENQLKAWRYEWATYENVDQELKYDIIFREIENLKQKYKNAC